MDQSQITEIFKLIGDVGFVVTAIVAILIYRQNKRAMFESNKRAAFAQLSQAYADWNINIVNNKDVRKLKSDLIWGQFGFDDTKVQKIHFLYNLLAILLMEWNICKDHNLPKGEEELDETFEELVGRINKPDRDFFMENADKLFGGFPKEFKEKVFQSPSPSKRQR